MGYNKLKATSPIDNHKILSQISFLATRRPPFYPTTLLVDTLNLQCLYIEHS